MRSPFQELVRLDRKQLVATLASQNFVVASMDSEEWLGLVQLLTTRIIDECVGLTAAEWRSSSRALGYVLESASAAGALGPGETAVRRLNLTAALFQKVSPNEEIDLLSADQTAELLFREIPIAPEQARALASRWTELDIEEIRQLRFIKNLLTPALMMKDALDDARLDTWEQIYPLLP
ncbi:hypothetical protein ABN034_11325 [Actinopolymorpha sp. B11F2]|uniref:hypothetical protein n=1 Tax=Actinopolymorpha sp. B11F2 TaxID=3160862 RepID=UPI0032E3AA37